VSYIESMTRDELVEEMNRLVVKLNRILSRAKSGSGKVDPARLIKDKITLIHRMIKDMQ
jgi:hypothetical protein